MSGEAFFKDGLNDLKWAQARRMKEQGANPQQISQNFRVKLDSVMKGLFKDQIEEEVEETDED